MADASSGSQAKTASDAPVGELVQRATEQITRLVREELTLVRGEMAIKGKRARAGAGMLSGGGALALYGGGALVAAIVLALGEVLPVAVAALVVAAVLLAVAGLLALRGKKQVNQAMPAVPTSAADSLRRDVDAVRNAATDRRQP